MTRSGSTAGQGNYDSTKNYNLHSAHTDKRVNWSDKCSLPIHSVIEFGLRQMRMMTPSLSYIVLFSLCSSCHSVKVKDDFMERNGTVLTFRLHDIHYNPASIKSDTATDPGNKVHLYNPTACHIEDKM